MTPEEYRQHVSDQLDEQKKPKYIEFIAPAKGEILNFKVDLDDVVSTTTQLSMLQSGQIPDMLIHDMYHKVDPSYELEEASVIIGIMMYAKKKVMLPLDIPLKRIWGLEPGFTNEDVDKALIEPLTEEENLWMFGEIVKGATPELLQLIQSLGI